MNGNLDNESFLAFKQGQPNGLGAIYKLYYTQVRYISQKYIKNQQDAEDITTQVFICLYEKRERFSSEQDIGAFLFFTAKNKCLDLQRSFKSRKTYKTDFTNAHDSEYSAALKDTHTQHEIIETVVLKQVYEEVQRLPNQCREVFKLIFFFGLPSSEIANRLSISPNTVRSQKRRAFEILRLRLADNPNTLTFLLLMSVLEFTAAI